MDAGVRRATAQALAAVLPPLLRCAARCAAQTSTHPPSATQGTRRTPGSTHPYN